MVNTLNLDSPKDRNSNFPPIDNINQLQKFLFKINKQGIIIQSTTFSDPRTKLDCQALLSRLISQFQMQMNKFFMNPFKGLLLHKVPNYVISHSKVQQYVMKEFVDKLKEMSRKQQAQLNLNLDKMRKHWLNVICINTVSTEDISWFYRMHIYCKKEYDSIKSFLQDPQEYRKLDELLGPLQILLWIIRGVLDYGGLNEQFRTAKRIFQLQHNVLSNPSNNNNFNQHLNLPVLFPHHSHQLVKSGRYSLTRQFGRLTTLFSPLLRKSGKNVKNFVPFLPVVLSKSQPSFTQSIDLQLRVNYLKGNSPRRRLQPESKKQIQGNYQKMVLVKQSQKPTKSTYDKIFKKIVQTKAACVKTGTHCKQLLKNKTSEKKRKNESNISDQQEQTRNNQSKQQEQQDNP